MHIPVVMYGCESWTIKLSAKELMLLNYGIGEDSWESFGLQGDQPVSPQGNQPWIFIGRTEVEAETPILWLPDAKNWLIGKDWCRERLRAEGKGGDRGGDSWMVSLTRWTWVWASSRCWWWTGKPGMLTERLNLTELSDLSYLASCPRVVETI